MLSLLRRFLVCACLSMFPQPQVSAAPLSQQIPEWTVFEREFQSSKPHKDPLLELSMEVVFRSPSGKERVIAGFWDGSNSWRVRFSPDELGEWSYQVRSSESSDRAWDGVQGTFQCVPYHGSNGLYVHGAVGLAPDKRYLEQADGTPFFWLSDTAWNGPLKADERSWAIYLEDRRRKEFTAVQFVTTQWIAAASDAEGRRAYSTEGGFHVDPEFFQRMDQRIQAINLNGMVAAPVLIWDVNPGSQLASLNPGTGLSDEQIVTLVKYQIARFGAYQVAWILAADGEYGGDQTVRWLKIGRRAFGDSPLRVVTLHPRGQQWIPMEFEDEPWFGFVSYQSGHGDASSDFNWLTSGPASKTWDSPKVHPIINLELNYEGHLSYQGRKPFDAHAVRRAAYWSLLVTPVAGIAYGAHGIWSWEVSPAVPMNHEVTGVAPPWSEALHLPGSTDMKYLRDFFDTLHWWTLRPAPGLLLEQPGAKDAAQFVAAAKSEKEGWAVLYFPVGQKVRLDVNSIVKPAVVRWFNPSTGQWHGQGLPFSDSGELQAPDGGDWVAWIGAAPAQ